MDLVLLGARPRPRALTRLRSGRNWGLERIGQGSCTRSYRPQTP